MRSSFTRFRVVVSYVGSILLIFGLLLLVPFIASFVLGGGGRPDVPVGTYGIPILVALALGLLCWHDVQRPHSRHSLSTPDAMFICVFSWVAISAVGALPFTYALHVSYLDGYVEAMSGFTTTGFTMLTGLDEMPRSLLLWRSMAQWVGGLGILTFFLAVVYQGGLSHFLFAAESHKIGGDRIAPGVWNTLKTLWLIYIMFTLLVAAGLSVLGMTSFDAVNHALTCLATGGYSTHDASIQYYEQAGYQHHVAIEYLLVVGMWAGGTNFLVHYRVLTGRPSELWGSDEMRLWWLVLALAVAAVLFSRLGAAPDARFGESFRHSLFQVTAIATGTGYATRDIGSRYFTPLAQQVFLVLMVIGGCAGSTSGGLKVIRVVVLWKLMVHEVRRALMPRSEVHLVLVDGKPLHADEARRVAALFVAWLFLLLVGSATTAALTPHGALASASGMFSAVGNVGPSFIPAAEMPHLHWFVKLVYILGMLAGRLEILPVLMLLSRRAWH